MVDEDYQKWIKIEYIKTEIDLRKIGAPYMANESVSWQRKRELETTAGWQRGRDEEWIEFRFGWMKNYRTVSCADFFINANSRRGSWLADKMERIPCT